MNTSQALRVIESLRYGIPPNGFVRDFTVGRKNEIDDLANILKADDGTALLINANYGSGKTHLLRYISELALDLNYAVSHVIIDSNSGVRFNRMDQIFGAVCRNIVIPKSNGVKGIRSFFDYLLKPANEKNSFWDEVSNYGKWDYSNTFDSPAVFIALRAWVFGGQSTHDIIEDWFYQPETYNAQRKKLYNDLINSLRKYFREARPEYKFYHDDIFKFKPRGYEQCWAALRDFNGLAKAFGLKGLIILFDEFEDVITNLKLINHQETAFWNLFYFYSGKKYPGKTFYAVTPAFVNKCKQRFQEKGRWDFDFSRFEALPQYEMSPLSIEHLEELSNMILIAHGIAYDWEPDLIMKQAQLKQIIEKAACMQIQDQARQVIKAIVEALDVLYEEL
jgi:hypothetical protein